MPCIVQTLGLNKGKRHVPVESGVVAEVDLLASALAQEPFDHAVAVFEEGGRGSEGGLPRGSDATVVAPLNAVPQALQNEACGGLTWPHWGQADVASEDAARGWPQLPQKFRPGGFSWPQRGHCTGASASLADAASLAEA